MTRETNAANARMVQMQNSAAAMESEKQRAYESATSQVSRYRAAGMSKAGALNALNGAGGYTPAPVNASQSVAPQEVAPQIDLSGIANAAMGMMQLKEQRRQFDAQLEENKRQFDATFGEQQINNAKARELSDAQIAHLAKQNDVSDAQIKQITANTDLTWQEIQNKMAEYNLTVQQTAKLVEETKLTTEQILQVKASTRLSNAQVETEFEKKKLTHEQVKTMSKEYERLAQEVDEFMSRDAKYQRENSRRLELEIKEFSRDIAGNDARVSEDRADASERRERASSIADMESRGCLAMWSYLTEEIFGFLPFATKR